MADGLDDTLLTDLRRLGMSPDETLIYLYLIKAKSATVADIHKASSFRKKKRPNLYKVLNRMREKTFLHSEVKEGRTLFFPVRPHIVLENLLLQKQMEFEELQSKISLMENRLESIHSAETISLDDIDSSISQFVRTNIPSQWIVNERPSIVKLEGTVKQMSIEFNTRRRFGGDAAGIVFFVFRYPNHIDALRERIISSLRDGMIDALESSKGNGSFAIKDYSFSQEEEIPGFEDTGVPYTKIIVYLNFMKMTGNGGFLVLRLEEFPSWVLGIWASSMDDLTLLLNPLFEKYTFKV
ncbi:MAG: helix-turn-helix domain-containing protein [Candidatus Thorarchaeota archaeon]|nr:helix-turn-helix domain-containing protein [Candidatus Thorarchaeota archaeon]